FTNYGQSPQFFNTGLGTATNITSVAFHDHQHGLAYGVNILGNHRITRSQDGGATWTLLTQQPDNTVGWSIAAVPGAPGFYVLAPNLGQAQGKVATTTNFGDFWSVENIGQS